MDRYSFSLMYTSQKVVKKYNGTVDVRKGTLKFRVKLDNICVTFNHCGRMVIIHVYVVKTFITFN